MIATTSSLEEILNFDNNC